MAQRRTELQGLVSHAIARRKEKERIGKIQRKVKTYFSSKYHLRFNRFVGDGNHGGTGVFSANKPAPPKPQQTPTTFSDPEKFIVKFSLGVTPNGDDGDQHLRNEAQWLRYLDGSEHFIASKAINHLEIKKSEERAIKDGEGTESSRKKKNQDNGAGGAPLGDGVLAALVSALGITSPAESGSNSQDHQDHKVIPFIILEYLPLGDLEQLRERMWTRWRWSGQPIPSRLLWGLLLCLIRMCIGLAYYTDMKRGQREEIQAGKAPSTLAHSSLKPPNVLLDLLNPGDGEHETTPLLKMIDFGRTGLRDHRSVYFRDRYADGAGVYSNLFYSGSIIETLAAVHTELQRGATWIPREDLFEWKERDTNNLLIETYAHGDFCRDKQIHIDLRLFVAELMCKFPEDRHYLREALDICLAHANMAAKDMYPDGVPEHETDDYIKQYVADVVLNAAPPVSAVLQMVV